MGLLLTGIVLLGFLPPVLAKPNGAFSLPLLYHIHGLIFLSWFGFYTFQASLVQGGRLKQHRQRGQWSSILAISMLVTGYCMMRVAFALPGFAIGENSHIASMMFPTTDLINFSIAFVLGLVHRANGKAHKRLMLLAGILILDPAVARLIETVGAPFPFIPIMELGLFGLLIGYDTVRLKRPHWASLLGLGLFFAAMIAKLSIANTPIWSEFATLLFA